MSENDTSHTDMVDDSVGSDTCHYSWVIKVSKTFIYGFLPYDVYFFLFPLLGFVREGTLEYIFHFKRILTYFLMLDFTFYPFKVLVTKLKLARNLVL